MDQGYSKFTLHGAKKPFTDEKQKQKAYAEVFGTELGSLVLQDILAEAGYFRAFIPQAALPDNKSAGAFDDGKKFVCHTILNTLSVVIKKKTPKEVMTQQFNNYETEALESYD